MQEKTPLASMVLPETPLDEIVRKAPVKMHVIDEDGNLVGVSDALAGRLGYSADEMLGRPHKEFLTADFQRVAETELLPWLAREGMLYRHPFDLVAKTGEIVAMRFTAVPLHGDHGLGAAALALISEDTAIGIPESELDKARGQAAQAQASKARFLDAVSHDFRTPLNAMLGFAQLLQRTQLSPRQAEQVEAMLAAGRQMMTRLSDMAELSQLEEPGAGIAPDWQEPAALIETLLANWHGPARDKGLALRVDLAPDLPREVFTDHTRLQQLTDQLMSNALKCTESGAICVSLSVVGQSEGSTRLRLSVKDTGQGISPERQKALLAQFADPETGVCKADGGLGVGMAICQRIAALLAGELSLESTAGQGTTFALCFPVRTR